MFGFFKRRRKQAEAPPPVDTFMEDYRKTEEAFRRLKQLEQAEQAEQMAEMAQTEPPPVPLTPVDPPLVVAYKAAQESKDGKAEVTPGTPRQAENTGALTATAMTPEEVAAYCAKTPVHVNRLAPPDGLSFIDRAAFKAILKSIPDHDRAKLYRRGGFALVRETVMEILTKMKAQDKGEAQS